MGLKHNTNAQFIPSLGINHGMRLYSLDLPSVAILATCSTCGRYPHYVEIICNPLHPHPGTQNKLWARIWGKLTLGVRGDYAVSTRNQSQRWWESEGGQGTTSPGPYTPSKNMFLQSVWQFLTSRYIRPYVQYGTTFAIFVTCGYICQFLW